MSKKEGVNQVVLYNKRDGKDDSKNNDKNGGKMGMNDGSKENIEYECNESALEGLAKEYMLEQSDDSDKRSHRGGPILLRRNGDKGQNQLERYTDKFKNYILTTLNLDCKAEFVDRLDGNEPYQRCCLFFNDNRKYRQLHELYKGICASVLSENNQAMFEFLF